jgi:hypothetical protein
MTPHTSMTRLSRTGLNVLVSALVLAPLIDAQCGNIKTVYNGGTTGSTLTMGSHRRALAFDAHKNLWSLVRRTVGTTSTLLLRRSTDGGTTWTATYNVPTVNGTNGAIVTGTHCETLHVLWSATGTSSLSSVYYRAFDTDTQTWIGSTTTLAVGTSSNDQYYANDIEVTSQARIAVTYSCRYTPPSNSPQSSFFNGSWSSTIRLAQMAAPGAHVFGPGKAINTGASGIAANMQAVGQRIHIIYRSATGGYGIHYRAFDTDYSVNGSFAQTTDTLIDPAGRATNIACIATDDDCTHCFKERLYVIYTVGATTAGSGRIMMAVAQATGADVQSNWTVTTVAADAPLMGGNYTYSHYSLAVGEDQKVYAVYSLKSQGHRRLYLREYKNGLVQGAPLIICATISNDRFAIVNGFRSTQVTSHVYASVSGKLSNINTGGYAAVFRRVNQARTVAYGAGCTMGPVVAGTPRLSSSNTPTIGTTYCITGRDLPSSSAGFMAIGSVCYQTPIALSTPFLPGCFQHQNWIAFLPVGSDSCGRLKLCVGIPNSLPLIGTDVFLQELHQIGTSFNFLATNSIQVLFGG